MVGASDRSCAAASSRRQAHLRHLASGPTATNLLACTAQVPHHLAAAILRAVQEDRRDHRHQRQRLFRFRHRCAIVTRSADPQQAARRRERQATVSRFDRRPRWNVLLRRSRPPFHFEAPFAAAGAFEL